MYAFANSSGATSTTQTVSSSQATLSTATSSVPSSTSQSSTFSTSSTLTSASPPPAGTGIDLTVVSILATVIIGVGGISVTLFAIRERSRLSIYQEPSGTRIEILNRSSNEAIIEDAEVAQASGEPVTIGNITLIDPNGNPLKSDLKLPQEIGERMRLALVVNNIHPGKVTVTVHYRHPPPNDRSRPAKSAFVYNPPKGS